MSATTTASTASSMPTARTPHTAQRPWPPDLSKMDPKHQLRLERRYRRRAKLAWARPRWTRAVKLAQGGSILFILGYGTLAMNWGDVRTPFPEFRKWVDGHLDSLWTATQPRRPNIGRIAEGESGNDGSGRA